MAAVADPVVAIAAGAAGAPDPEEPNDGSEEEDGGGGGRNDDEDDDDDDDDEAFITSQLLCFEDMVFEVERCGCHGYVLRRVGLAVGTRSYTDFALYLCSMLVHDLTVMGIYYVVSWACPMFINFGPVFLHRELPGGIVGMLIHVPPYPVELRSQFVMAIAQLGVMGALPCHYLRRMEIDEQRRVARMVAPSWYTEVVNALYCWAREEADRAYEQEEDE